MKENLKLWNRKLVQIGNSYGFVIPKTFIEDSKHVQKGQMYIIEIKPLHPEDGNEQSGIQSRDPIRFTAVLQDLSSII